MGRTFRGALVGFGQVAEKAHVPAFAAAPGLELVAVAEERPERRAAAAAALPGARLHESLDALLAARDGLDFVVVATPPFLHARQARAAMEAGLGVLCEKPLALSLDELSALEAAAARSRRALMTVHNWAFSPQWLKVRELVASGALGEIRHASLSVLRTKPAASALPGDWRREAALAGGGILVDHGWHCLYLLGLLIPGEPARVWASARRPEAGGVEDEIAALLEYPRATAALHLTWRAAARANRATAVGTRGVLELRDDHLLLDRGQGTPERFAFAEPLSAGSAHPEWLAAALPGFAAALADPARANLDEASACLRTIARLYDALPGRGSREAVPA